MNERIYMRQTADDVSCQLQDKQTTYCQVNEKTDSYNTNIENRGDNKVTTYSRSRDPEL